MSTPLERFFEKFTIKPESIKSLTRADGKTFINMVDGRHIETYYSVKNILDALPGENFVMVNKGTALALNQIERVEGTTYYLIDGTTVTGRKRRSAKQTQLVNYINDSILECQPKMFSIDRYKVLDDMPLAFCIIEVLFTENGRGIDFIFRYCNREMANIEGRTMDEMMNHSFYEVFPNADKKWLVAYSDVALNGNVHNLDYFSNEAGRPLHITCFQPKEGYCACLLQTTNIDSQNKQTAVPAHQKRYFTT